MNKISIPIQIKIELLKKGITMAEIARRLGCRRWAVSMVVNGVIASKRIRKAICEDTGLPETIWEEMDKERKAA